MTQTGRFGWRGAHHVRSSADLLRDCGRKLTDRGLWDRFHERFQKQIFTYVLRAVRQRRHVREDISDLVADLAQDVYMRMLKHDGRLLRSFKGNTDFSVFA